MFAKKNIIEVTENSDLSSLDAKLQDEVKFLRSLPFSNSSYNKKVWDALKDNGYTLDFCHTGISARRIKIDFDEKRILFGSYNISGAYRAYIKKF
jgi:hypothetical protein